MPTPPKPVSILQLEKKSHRTKAELAQRDKAEQSLLTGMKIREESAVKKNPVAHKEFLRMKKLLRSIEKADDLYGATINRYCMLKAEEAEFLEKRTVLSERIDIISDELTTCKDDGVFRDLAASLASLQKTFVSLDRNINAKRKMQADIEKENVMTIASALRSIPKKAKEENDPVKEILSGRST